MFGMPGELVKLGGADFVLPAKSIARQLISWLTFAAAATTFQEARHGSR